MEFQWESNTFSAAALNEQYFAADKESQVFVELTSNVSLGPVGDYNIDMNIYLRKCIVYENPKQKPINEPKLTDSEHFIPQKEIKTRSFVSLSFIDFSTDQCVL